MEEFISNLKISAAANKWIKMNSIVFRVLSSSPTVMLLFFHKYGNDSQKYH